MNRTPPASLINYEALAAAMNRQMMSNLAGNKEFAVGLKHDASGNPVETGFMHGPNGLLRIPGVAPDVMHTILGNMGILSQLQWTGSVFMNPLYETITGITAGDTDHREEVCDDAPTAGTKKGCIVSAAFGWIQRGTQEVDVTRLGQRLDRSDPQDLFLVGSVPGVDSLPGLSAGFGNDQLVNEWSNLLGNRAVTMARDLAHLTYTGDPANNTNGYQEFPGLQKLVSTGHVDAITGTSCPSMDSLIMDFDYARIDENMGDLVTKMTYMARYNKSLAMRTGVTPVRWAWVMKEELFYHVTRAWACAYLMGATCQVIDQATGRLTLDARDNVELRDQMYNGQFLIIDGQRWPVIFDDAIPEESAIGQGELAPGCFASDIYLLPFSILNGRSVLYGEYFSFENPSTSNLFGTMFLGRTVGAFLEVPRQTNNCFVVDLHIKPRIILRTPWLAGRINNVAYCPLLHTRDPFPGDNYFVNGGVEGSRTAPTYQNNWD